MNERSLGRVSVVNHGSHSIHYRWVLSERCLAAGGQGSQLVSITPAEGSVGAHNRACCELTFAPPKKMTLKDCQLTLEVHRNDVCVSVP